MTQEDKPKPEVQIKLESSFIGVAFYVIFRLGQTVQAALPTLLVWVVKGPALWIFRRPKAEWKEGKAAKYRVDTKKRGHRITWSILLKLHTFSQWFAGMNSDRDLYQRLLVWNTQFPAIGYQDGGLDTAIEYLGKTYADGGRSVNLYWITTPIPIGKFQVVSKKLDENGKATIQCVWITGKLAGTSFDIASDFSQYKSWRDPKTLPARIYFPNRLLVWLAEGATSAALILSIIGLSDKGVVVLGTLWTKAGQAIADIAKFVVKLFH